MSAVTDTTAAAAMLDRLLHHAAAETLRRATTGNLLLLGLRTRTCGTRHVQTPVSRASDVSITLRKRGQHEPHASIVG